MVMEFLTMFWPQLGAFAFILVAGVWLVKRLFNTIDKKDAKIEAQYEAAMTAFDKNTTALIDLRKTIEYKIKDE